MNTYRPASYDRLIRRQTRFAQPVQEEYFHIYHRIEWFKPRLHGRFFAQDIFEIVDKLWWLQMPQILDGIW